MKTIAIHTKKTSVLSIEHPFERAVFRSLSAALIVLAVAYIYFVSSSVLHVMSRKEALTQSAQIQGAIGNLESGYFSLSQSVTLDSASDLGLVPMQNPSYVKSPGSVGMAPRDQIRKEI